MAEVERNCEGLSARHPDPSGNGQDPVVQGSRKNGARGGNGQHPGDALAPTVAFREARAALAMLSSEGQIMAANEAWKEFARSVAEGNEAACLPGEHYTVLCRRIQVQDAAVIRQGIELVLSGAHSGFTWEFQVETAVEPRWHLLTVTPMAGPFGGAVLAGFDITSQKQTHKRLELFRKLIDQSSDAIFVVDPVSARILDVNQRACASLGYSPDELLGLTMMDVEVAYDSFTWPEQVQKARAGELEILESGQRRKGGEAFPVEISLKHVELENRQYIVAAARDITEKKQLEAKFLRAQRLESVGRLAGGIAHDLNNVLSPVLLAIQLLRQKMPDAEAQEILDLVETSTRRGTGMIKQVLTFARGIKGERVAIHFRELINEIVKMGRETFPRSIQLRATAPADLWPAIGDSTQLHQVLMNLCVNACDAMPEGGVLDLRAENARVDEKQARACPGARPGAYVVLTVRDTGVGIPAQILDKIFEPFFTTKSFGKGTGLGLATALGIVRAHGGFVTVESEINKGSCFRIHLPTHGDPTNAPTEPVPSEAMRGREELILVVDDEKSIRVVTRSVLTANGYNVVTADDGAEAVAFYKERQADIRAVVMDISMPHMDGVAAICGIRKLSPTVPILVVSGLMDSEQLSALSGDALVSFLTKPYAPDQLLRGLDRFLGKRQPELTT